MHLVDQVLDVHLVLRTSPVGVPLAIEQLGQLRRLGDRDGEGGVADPTGGEHPGHGLPEPDAHALPGVRREGQPSILHREVRRT